MAHKHRRKCLQSLVIREVEIIEQTRCVKFKTITTTFLHYYIKYSRGAGNKMNTQLFQPLKGMWGRKK